MSPARHALTAVAVGASTGGGIVCAILIGAYGLRMSGARSFADIALAAAATGLLAAAATASLIARRLGAWRAAGAAMVAVSGTALVGALTVVADALAGRIGLAILMSFCLAVLVLAKRSLVAASS